MLSQLDIFSDDQAITATAASTNNTYVGEFAGQGEPIKIEAKVTADFNNLTSLTVAVQECATAGGTYETVVTTPAVLAASLVAGYEFKFNYLPKVEKPYVRLYYTVAGTAPTTGTVFAALEPGGDDTYKDGLYFSPTNSTGAAATA